MKEDIKEILTEFLSEADAGNLKTKQFPKAFWGFKLRVSFGQGGTSRIPWISFLGDGQSTSKGIYPVYLYFKEYKKLVLAYGVSEENSPEINWDIDAESIKDHFKQFNAVPRRYGSSYVYNIYDVNDSLDWREIQSNLEDILARYKEVISKVRSVTSKLINKSFALAQLKEDLEMAGYRASASVVTRFVASLLTKPFVILTGLSGSGKTKLAMAFAKWICEEESQICVVPVGADWTNREPLLGYPNALENGKYILPENGALSLMLRASQDMSKPYFLILDEMNLSHVERYFADFLSGMESAEGIPLHADGVWTDDVPTKISLPKNLFIVGTVNIDETTYMFSPKVLDRANVIEFRVSADEMASYLKKSGTIDLNSLEVQGADMAASFIEIASDFTNQPNDKEQIAEALLSFFKELKKTGAEFGYRSASEILRFAAIINKIEPQWSMDEIIDAAIMQKLLPKVHGARRKLDPILTTLGTLCLQGDKKIDDVFDLKKDNNYSDKATYKYPVSIEKIVRMYRGLIDNGFTSYAEA